MDVPMREKLKMANDFVWPIIWCTAHPACDPSKHCQEADYRIEGPSRKHAVFKPPGEVPRAVPIDSRGIIGHTRHASVDRVTCDTNRMTYPGYFARKTIIDDSKEAPRLELAKAEAKNMENLRHPHVVLLLGTYMQADSFAILMYPAAKSNLENHLIQLSHVVRERRKEHQSSKRRDDIPSEVLDLRSKFGCLARGLQYLHDNKEVRVKHLDLKPANILIDHFGNIVIADLGSCHTYDISDPTATDSPLQQTYEYSSPEATGQGKRSHATDIFSGGCVFLEMITLVVGETLENLKAFCAGESRDTSDYTQQEIQNMRNDKPPRDFWYGDQVGRVHTWIDMLKEKVNQNQQQWVFSEEDQEKYVVALDTIRRMLSKNATLNLPLDDLDLSEEEKLNCQDFKRPSAKDVWEAFQDFSATSSRCEDCFWHEEIISGTPKDYSFVPPRGWANEATYAPTLDLSINSSRQTSSRNSTDAGGYAVTMSDRPKGSLMGDDLMLAATSTENDPFEHWLSERSPRDKIMVLDVPKSRFFLLRKAEIPSKCSTYPEIVSNSTNHHSNPAPPTLLQRAILKKRGWRDGQIFGYPDYEGNGALSSVCFTDPAIMCRPGVFFRSLAPAERYMFILPSGLPSAPKRLWSRTPDHGPASRRVQFESVDSLVS